MQSTLYPPHSQHGEGGPLGVPPSSRRLRRTALDFAAIYIGLILLALVVGALSWQFWHANRIFTGVTVAGVPIGGMTRASAIAQLDQSLQTVPLPPVSLGYDNRLWPLGAASPNSGQASSSIRVQADLMAAINEAYLVGRRGRFSNRIVEQLRSFLAGFEVAPQMTFDRGHLRQLVSQVASIVHQPTLAGREIDGVIVAPQPGVDVDVEGTLQLLIAELYEKGHQRNTLTVPLVVHQSMPPVADVATVSNGAGSPLGATRAVALRSPLIVRNGSFGLEMALDPKVLDDLLFSASPPRLDPDRVARLLDGWAEQIDIPARDARLQFNPATGTTSILQTSQTGRSLNIEATAAAMQEALDANAASSTLVIDAVVPAIDMNRIPEMGINELVSSGTSYFRGSSAARIHNIEVAAAKFEGVVIPPGGIFSFNEHVEDVTSANGFDESLIIFGNETAVGVGGGVCQVSTTVFRAAYEAGMPIVERYNHGYVVGWYGAPGLDATIYTPSVDFRFRNDTANHILIDPIVDSAAGVITFNFYGTKPARQVIIGEPTQSEVVEPEPPVYREDTTLATGQIEQVEYENKGMIIEVQRTIIENGETRTDAIRSKYRPWQAVYEYGPGTAIPEQEEAEAVASEEGSGEGNGVAETAPAAPDAP